MRPEYAVFDHTKLEKRLKSLQKSAGKLLSRAEMDETRFEVFVSMHYERFRLKAFRNFVKQEVRTGKWKHTLAVKGKQFKAS
jgi:hypothetical protein